MRELVPLEDDNLHKFLLRARLEASKELWHFRYSDSKAE